MSKLSKAAPFHVGPSHHHAPIDVARRFVAYEAEDGTAILDCSHPAQAPRLVPHRGAPIAVAASGRRIALLNEDEITIVGSATLSFPVPEPLDNTELLGAFSAAGDLLWLHAKEGSDTVWLIDAKNGSVRGHVEVGGLEIGGRLITHPTRPLVVLETTQPQDYSALIMVEARHGGPEVTDRLDDFEEFVSVLGFDIEGDALLLASSVDLFRYSLAASKFERQRDANELFATEGQYMHGGAAEGLVSILWTDGEQQFRGCFFSADLVGEPSWVIELEDEPYGMEVCAGGVAAAPFMDQTHWYRLPPGVRQ